jgi:hypothetical protein
MAGDADNPTPIEGGVQQQQPVEPATQGGGVAPPVNPSVAEQDESGPDPLADSNVLVTDHIRKEVGDALELTDYIIKTGTRKADGSSLPADTLRMIKVMAGRVRLFEHMEDDVYPKTQPKVRYAAAQEESVFIKASEWTRFELAYYALAEFSDPVTIDTLRDTRHTGQGNFRGASSAQKFTWLLWFITICFVFVVLVCGGISTGADSAVSRDWLKTLRLLNDYVAELIPWAYGGLGACAYLLRTAHDLIAKRSFDVRRKPEYLNRILLGAVSGGAIVLLVSSGGDDDTVKISAAALGFLAGYSNDLLFNAVERVTTALLPKVGLDTVQKDRFVPKQIELPTGGLTLKDMMEKLEKAGNPEDKELYRSLIAKLRDRL